MQMSVRTSVHLSVHPLVHQNSQLAWRLSLHSEKYFILNLDTLQFQKYIYVYLEMQTLQPRIDCRQEKLAAICVYVVWFNVVDQYQRRRQKIPHLGFLIKIDIVICIFRDREDVSNFLVSSQAEKCWVRRVRKQSRDWLVMAL